MSTINFLTRAATIPAIIVPKVQAILVKSLVGVKYRSIPPIKPAIKPAGHPKISPADKGDALLTFKTAPSRCCFIFYVNGIISISLIFKLPL